MTPGHRTEPSRGQLLRDAALTLTAVLVAFAAFDDITTDTATTFTAERIGLAVCGVWLVILSSRLLRGEQRWLGAISMVVVVAGVSAGSRIRPGTGPFDVAYLLTIAGLLWFSALVAILAAQAWRWADQHAA
jgi:peptidoglycan/LPS O-acetylase OafA/YrhL